MGAAQRRKLSSHDPPNAARQVIRAAKTKSTARKTTHKRNDEKENRMSEWIDCTLDVVATNPKEMNDIASALRNPPREFLLVAFAASERRRPDDVEIEQAREVIAFKTAKDLPHVAEIGNKVWRFENSYRTTCEGVIDWHLSDVSAAFPNAIFLADYCNLGWNCVWKRVLRNGVTERSVSDGDQPAQGIDWVVLDIFAPFRTEYQNGRPFGSMWKKWVDDLVAAANGLRDLPRSTSCTAETTGSEA